ncbi:MAG: porin [Bacteroidales bacterium]
MKARRILFLLAVLLSLNSFAQQKSLLDSINIYGSLRAHLAVYDRAIEMQNNGSRFGFNLDRNVIGGFTAEAKVELGINLLKNNNSFKSDAATADNPNAYLVETVKPITTRLGYIGFESPKWGTLRIGKQWGVYYDVSAYTDNFNVFGGSASGTYNTSTDGGGEGTGRAESAISYHKTIRNLSMGVQAQFPLHTFNCGGSLLYKLPLGFTIGAAYNYYEIPESLKLAVANFQDVAHSAVGLLMYNSQKSMLAFTFAYNQSESQYPTDSTIVGFAANGTEFYAHHYFTKKLLGLAGFNLLKPTGTNNSLPDGFKIFTIMAGAAYTIVPDLFCYSEFQINNGVLISGEKGNNVFTVGLKYNFSFGRGNFIKY